MAKWIISELPEETPVAKSINPQESWGETAKRVGIASGSKAASGLQGFLSTPARLAEGVVRGGIDAYESLTGEPTEAGNLLRKLAEVSPSPKEIKSLPEQYAEQSYGKEYLEPRNAIESGIQRFAGQAPAAALTGGVGQLPYTALGAGAAAGAQALGLPEWAQDVSQIATEVGAGYGVNRFGPDRLKSGKYPSVREVRSQAYDKMRKSGGKYPTEDPARIEQAFSQVGDALSNEVDGTIEKSVRSAMERMNDKIFVGKVSPQDLFTQRNNLYDLANKLPEDKVKQYIYPLTQSVNDLIKDYSVKNPSFFFNMDKGDRLKTLEMVQPELTKAATDLMKAISTKSSLYNIGAKTLQNVWSAAKWIATPLSIGSQILTNEHAAKFYLDAVGQMATDNPNNFMKTLSHLGKVLGSPQEEKPKAKWIIK